jgi:exosortase N
MAGAYFPAIFLMSYLALGLFFIPEYFKWDANAIMGILSLPYICTIEKGRLSLRYIYPAICFLIFSVLLPVNTLFFLALLFAVLLLIENSFGKISPVLFFMLILVSPVFKNITRMFEFPVRLWLSDEVAGLLHFCGLQASAAGNIINLDKNEYAVDPACAGLNMLATSLLICLLVIAFYQHQSKKKLPFKCLAIVVVATAAVNVICNFFRILVLVLFKVMPDNFFHDATGLGCLLLYVIVPLLYGLPWVFKRFAKPDNKLSVRTSPSIQGNIRHIFFHLIFLILLFFVAGHLVKADSLYVTSTVPAISKAYTKSSLPGGIMKFQNRDALIYLKPNAFYAPEHDPMICWTGSGYQFKNIKTMRMAGVAVYTAMLTKNEDKLYASWWFDNGEIKTINQLQWRWLSAKGAKPFYLINVNSADPVKLRMLTDSLLRKNTIGKHEQSH